MRRSGSQRLGVLLARAPEHEDFGRAIDLVLSSAAEGEDVSLFLMTDGVDVLGSPDALALDRENVRVVACTLSANLRGAPTDLPFVDYASQFQLAEIVGRSDRFVSFA